MTFLSQSEQLVEDLHYDNAFEDFRTATAKLDAGQMPEEWQVIYKEELRWLEATEGPATAVWIFLASKLPALNQIWNPKKQNLQQARMLTDLAYFDKIYNSETWELVVEELPGGLRAELDLDLEPSDKSGPCLEDLDLAWQDVQDW